jgi:hypothetical protein
MSRRTEILHRLNKDDRIYLTEKFKEKDQRIAELEEQLKNKPKYNVGDRVYVINEDYEVERDFVESIDIDTDGIEYYTIMNSICWYENELFKTEEEAQAKLKKLLDQIQEKRNERIV